MTLMDLYILLHPLIDVLGTVTLILLVAGCAVAAVVWFFKTFWKPIVITGVIFLFISIAVLLWGGM